MGHSTLTVPVGALLCITLFGVSCNAVLGIDEAKGGRATDPGHTRESGGNTNAAGTDSAGSGNAGETGQGGVPGAAGVPGADAGSAGAAGSASARINEWVPIPPSDVVTTDRAQHTAVWTGEEMIVWGGTYFRSPPTDTGARYNPRTGVWKPTTRERAPSARAYHTAIWTDEEMIIWGGGSDNSGARYEPKYDRWRPMRASPVARSSHQAVWTGKEMIVWCGLQGEGAQAERYVPKTDEWLPVSSVGAPACTRGSALWTGKAFIVWGGMLPVTQEEAERGETPKPTNIGGVYDPEHDAWRSVTTVGAPSPRSGHSAVWTGTHMLIWGGSVREGDVEHPLADGGLYDPVLDRWEAVDKRNVLGTTRHLTVWAPAAGARPGLMLVWGGSVATESGGSHEWGEGHTYDPMAREWQRMSIVGEPWARSAATALWTGTEMIVWGGLRSQVENFTTGRDGGRYLP